MGAAARAGDGRSRRGRMRWAWVMAVVALVAAGTVFYVQRSEAKPSGPVAIVGDSITFLSTGAYRQELEPQYSPEIKGVLGVTVGGMAQTAARMAATHP